MEAIYVMKKEREEERGKRKEKADLMRILFLVLGTQRLRSVLPITYRAPFHPPLCYDIKSVVIVKTVCYPPPWQATWPSAVFRPQA
jgi:hypothetical protein